MKRNIMVFGIRGSGKDTLVDYLIEKNHYTKMRLAKYVIDACKAFGIESPTKTDLVYIGTEIGRNLIDPDVWIKMALKEMKKTVNYRAQYSMTANFIVSDVRFHNEYEAFLGRGFFPIMIDAPKDVCIERVKERDGEIDGSLFNHQSETNSVDFVGYRIVNNGTLDDLYSQIDSLMEKLQDDMYYASMMHKFKMVYSERKRDIG